MSNDPAERPQSDPFDDPEHTEVLASRDIIEAGARIIVVAHHENGQWGFYSGSAARDPKNVVKVIFDELIEHDPGIFRMGFVKKGKMAIRMGTGMHERWIFPDDEKPKSSRGGCLGLLLFLMLGAAIVLRVLASFRLLS